MASRQDVRRFQRQAGAAVADVEQALRLVAEADGTEPAVLAAADLIEWLGFGGFALGSIGIEGDAARVAYATGWGPVARAAEAYAASGMAAQDLALRRFVDAWRVTDLTPLLTAERRSPPAGDLLADNLLAHGVTAAALLPLTTAGAARVAAAVAGRPDDDPAAFARRLRDRGWLARLGLMALADRLTNASVAIAPGLTRAERAVLRELARGLRPCEIAATLGKSERTVRGQIESARGRLGARTPAAAVAAAIRAGLILP